LGKTRIATLAPGSVGCPLISANAAFDKGFQDLGYDPLPVIEYRCFDQIGELPRLVAETIASKPPLVVVWGTTVAVRLLHESAPNLPIVFVNFGDPVGAGLVESLSRPGGKITGISNATEELLAKRVEILKEALPRATHLAVLFNVSNPVQQDRLRTTQLAARKVNVDARAYAAPSANDLASAFAAMKSDGMDAVVLLPDIFFYVNREQVSSLARRFKIPLMSYTTAYVEVGGLFVYGPNLDDMSYRAATYVDKILRGSSPSEIPVELPTLFDFVVNAKTAREIGVSLPSSVVLRATRVID
jgi:putative ABC transport system substrate-binding protein